MSFDISLVKTMLLTKSNTRQYERAVFVAITSMVNNK